MDRAEQIEVLKGLLERVKAAETWDRNIDAALEDELGEASEHPGEHLLSGMSGGRPRWLLSVSPYYTKSVDAALSLVSRSLPAFGYRLQTELGGRPPVCTLHAPPECPQASITDGRSWSKHYDGAGATAGLAICAALLSAKLALLTQEGAP